MSGRPGSNWPPEAWKATALPNELLPLMNLQICRYANVQIIKRTTIQILQIGTFAYMHIEFCGQSRFRTYVLVREQIYSLSPLTTRPSAQNIPIKKKVQKTVRKFFKEPKTGVEPATFPTYESGCTIQLPKFNCLRAENWSRTSDLLITNQLLYQLSYFGLYNNSNIKR
jgi:hypothetical protein